MVNAISIFCALLTLAALWCIFRSFNEAILLDTSDHFASLVACSDTQTVNACWMRFGPTLLSSVRSKFSDLAYHLVEGCLQRAESRQLQDLSFILDVQQCFFVAELINAKSTCPLRNAGIEKESVVESWCTWLQTAMIIFLVLRSTGPTIVKLCSEITIFLNSSVQSYDLSISALTNWLRVVISKINSNATSDEANSVLAASVRTILSTAILAAKCSFGAENSEDRLSKEVTTNVASLTKQARSLSKMNKSSEPSVHRKELKELAYDCACEFSDYDTHVVCGHECEDSSSKSSDDDAERLVGIIPDLSHCRDTAISRTAGTSVDGTSFHESDRERFPETSHMQIEECDEVETDQPLQELSSEEANSAIQAKSSKERSVRESPRAKSETKPSFDITTEIGRAQMKAYINSKVKFRKSGPLLSHYDDQSSFLREASNNEKKRRVFVANKGWIWLSRSETYGVHFISDGKNCTRTSHKARMHVSML